MTTLAQSPEISTSIRRWPNLLRETGIAVGLFVVWQYLVWFKGRHTPIGAISRGRLIWHVEQFLHVNIETSLQHISHPMWNVANVYYDLAHVGGMAALIVCVVIRARSHWHFFRNTLFISTFLGLLFQFAISTAPPRFIGIHGLVDTANAAGVSIYAAAGSHVDQYSSFPSLHVAWAAVVAIVAYKCFHSRWRYLGIAHLVATTLAVMITGNHFVLDCVAGSLLAFAGSSMAEYFRRRSQ